MSQIAAAAVSKVAEKHKEKKEIKKAVDKAAAKSESTAQKAAKKAKTGAKKAVKGGGKRLQNSKFNPGSKHWRAPVSYSVRKQHNLLIGMWFATSATYCFAYYNTPGITIQTFWKRFIAIQFVFFILSIAVLFDTFARAVGLFSTLVFLGVLFTNGNAVLAGFKAISSGIKPPIGSSDSVAGDFGHGTSGSFDPGNSQSNDNSGGDFSNGSSGGFDPSTGNGFNNGVTT